MLQVAPCSAPVPTKSTILHVCVFTRKSESLKKKKRSYQAVCHVPSSPLALRYTGLSTQMSQRVSVHLYLNMQGLHRSAAVTHTHTQTQTQTHCLLVPGGASGFEYRPNQLCKNNLFLPQGYTKNRPLFNHNYLN